MSLCQRNNHLLAGGWGQVMMVLCLVLAAAFLMFNFISGDWKISLPAAGALSAALLLIDFLTFKIRAYFARKLYSQTSSNK